MMWITERSCASGGANKHSADENTWTLCAGKWINKTEQEREAIEIFCYGGAPDRAHHFLMESVLYWRLKAQRKDIKLIRISQLLWVFDVSARAFKCSHTAVLFACVIFVKSMGYYNVAYSSTLSWRDELCIERAMILGG